MRISRTVVALAGALLLACGGSEQVVLLNGAGATFPNLIYQKWIIDYNSAHSGVQLNYQSIGSGGGVRQFADGTTDFGATDAPMTDDELATVNGTVYHIPTVLGAVVPTHNLPEVTTPVRFGPETLAGIFLGDITRWNDPRIASENPKANLPATDIVVVHRSDGSGTTFVWTDYLTKVSSAWSDRVGAGRSVNWPVGLGARGNEGVTATVKQTPGAIGYVELGYALLNSLPVSAVRNKSGNFVTPTIESVTAAAAGAMEEMSSDTDFRVSITDPSGGDAYPIASFTWLLLHQEYADAHRAGELAKFVWWALTEGRGEAAPLGYAPIPTELTPWIAARLSRIAVNGQPVWTAPPTTDE
jgi:phosphate transport system substrate-binding protein